MSDDMTIDDLTVVGIDGIRRSFDEHYDTMMCVEQDPTGAHHVIHNQHARIEELEAKLAKAVDALEGWINVYTHCTIEAGVCCCGDDMNGHQLAMDSNHMPLDHGAYIAGELAKQTETTLAEMKGEHP